MKKHNILNLLAGILIAASTFPTVTTAAPAGLTQAEQQDLLFMREEKLARDVYLSLYDQWNLRVFQNIARAEQRHTDQIKSLLSVYQLADPVDNDSRGVFQNTKLQALYNELIAKGMQSETAALEVGAYVEETDIKDIQDAIARSNIAQIDDVYANLMRGSRNHLRAFAKNLSQRGMSYRTQVLPQDEFDAIANSPRERGNRGGRGQGRQ